MPQAGHRKRGARGHRQHRQHPLSQDGQALLGVVLPPAEDPAQDDLQRQRAQARVQRDGDVSRPRGDRTAHGVEHPLRLPLDHTSLQRGQHDPAPVQMILLVEQHERARTDDRPDGRPALSRMQGLRGRRQHRPDVGRIAQEHKLGKARHPHREAAAVATAAPLQARQRRAPHQTGLQRGGQRHAGRLLLAGVACPDTPRPGGAPHAGDSQQQPRERPAGPGERSRLLAHRRRAGARARQVHGEDALGEDGVARAVGKVCGMADDPPGDRGKTLQRDSLAGVVRHIAVLVARGVVDPIDIAVEHRDSERHPGEVGRIHGLHLLPLARRLCRERQQNVGMKAPAAAVLSNQLNPCSSANARSAHSFSTTSRRLGSRSWFRLWIAQSLTP